MCCGNQKNRLPMTYLNLAVLHATNSSMLCCMQAGRSAGVMSGQSCWLCCVQVRKSRKDAERKKSRMSGDRKPGGAADAAGSSRATGTGGKRFSKSTHAPPAPDRGGQSAGRGRGGSAMRGMASSDFCCRLHGLPVDMPNVKSSKGKVRYACLLVDIETRADAQRMARC